MPSDDDPTDGEEVLTPDDLDIADDERVAEIEDGRYVISSTGDRPSVPEEIKDGDQTPDSPDATTKHADEEIYAALRESVRAADARYGFDVTAKFGESVKRQELFSNDVVTTFENLLVWYSQHVGDDTPVEEALGILLVESTVPVRYPAGTVQSLVSAYDLEPDDSIEDLFKAVGDRGIRFPPEDFQQSDTGSE